MFHMYVVYMLLYLTASYYLIASYEQRKEAAGTLEVLARLPHLVNFEESAQAPEHATSSRQRAYREDRESLQKKRLFTIFRQTCPLT